MQGALKDTGYLSKYVDKDNCKLRKNGHDQFQMSIHKTNLSRDTSIALYYHWHEELEILFMTKGIIRVSVAHEQYILSSGDILIIPPTLPHKAYQQGTEDIEFFTILVHMNFLSSCDYDLIQDKYILPVFMGQKNTIRKIDLNNVHYAEIRKNIEYILKWYRIKHKGYELLIKSNMYYILYYLIEGWNKEENDSVVNYNLKWIRDILYYINNNYNRKISLTEMANYVGMSKGYFCRSMKKAFNESAMDFLNRYRVIKSVELIRNTDKKLGDIAFEVGFSNVNSFTDSFKNIMGCTPSQFRQKLIRKVL